ncbi:MAG: ferrochelatase, partial [Opitutales bacterium]|nr:ferrochelatase [Opitutales bacterium]
MKSDTLILVGLGAPSPETPRGCEIFLREFLGDAHVLPAPRLLRKFLAKRISKKRSAAYSEKIAGFRRRGGRAFFEVMDSLRGRLKERLGAAGVFYGSTFGEKSVESAVKEAVDSGFGKSAVFILCHPQACGATTLPALEKVRKAAKILRPGSYKIVDSYCENPAYISALARAIKKTESADILMSFHSVMTRQIKTYDYPAQCRATLSALQGLLPEKRLHLTWQSAMNFGKWLEPKTEDFALGLLRGGQRNAAVACPGFFYECVETELEINSDLRRKFLEAGGEKFEYVPCFGDSEAQVEIV